MGLFDSIFAPGEQQRGDALDAAIKLDNQRKADQGRWTQAQADAANANIDANYIAVDDQIGSEFSAGLSEGAGNFRRSVDNFLSGAVGNFIKAVPYWVWFGLAAGAVVYFWPVIRKAFKR